MLHEFKNARSVGALAKYLGVPRQRIYNEINRGHIKAEIVGQTKIISPEECARVIKAAIVVQTASGRSIRFDWI
jgi:predicted transcriptional regulator